MATKTKEASKRVPARNYPDLHDHLKALDDAGLLVTVDREINKDTEMHPLVRWQFRGGIEEKDRKAFLFTNVVDTKGKKFDMPVAVGVLAANRKIYAMGMGCAVEEVQKRWNEAIASPISPNPISGDEAPCQEIVIEGAELDQPGNALDSLPVPISTPGWDVGPVATLTQFVTKDPDNGLQNMGNYRAQVKGKKRMGMNPSLELRPGIYTHWEKMKARGEKLPAAVVLGAPSCVTFTAAQKLPEQMEEITVAGGLVGSPVNVVRARTVDLMVPAEAEVVVEGFIDTEMLEPEAPFGESHGHVNLQEFNAFMDVTCITRRSNAVMTSIISQVTPSESSCIKQVAYETIFINHMRDALGIKGIQRVALHEPLTNIRKLIVLVCDRGMPRTEIWRGLYGAATLLRAGGKFVIAVNDDIDPSNADALFWAMAYRCNPILDMEVLPHRDQGHGPRSKRNNGEDGSVLYDATLKENFPPISLPKRHFMENAAKIWEEIGLPKLKPEKPWFGYSLGEWGEDFEEAAKMATDSEYWAYGERIAQRRRSDVSMNTEVRDVDETS